MKTKKLKLLNLQILVQVLLKNNEKHKSTLKMLEALMQKVKLTDSKEQLSEKEKEILNYLYQDKIDIFQLGISLYQLFSSTIHT